MIGADNNGTLPGLVLIVIILTGCGGGSSSTENCENLPAIQVREIAPALDGSGDINVGGYFTKYDDQSRNFLVRINRNGSPDKDFDI